MIATLARRCLEGDLRAVARLISFLEDGQRSAFKALDILKEKTGTSWIIGITGPPGSGKSTLTDKLIGAFRSRGLRVGVLAVDPSSPFSGGAILGDRLRMQSHATDEGVFIRSLASRGRLGGLSGATSFAAKILEAAGYDIVIIETVGVGQSEVDIVKVADTVVLVSVPGLGDDIQVIKAGIMEIGDVFVVNKSDREGADRVVREIRGMLETQAMLQRGRLLTGVADTLAGRNEALLHHSPAAKVEPSDEPEALSLPPVLKTVAETGEGVSDLVLALTNVYENAGTTGTLAARRLRSIKSQLKDLVSWRLMDFFAEREGEAYLDGLALDVYERKHDIYSAAGELYAALVKGGIS